MDPVTDEKVKRLIFLNDIHHQYIVGDPDQFERGRKEEKLETVKHDLSSIHKIAENAANDPSFLPRKSILLRYLAATLVHTSTSEKRVLIQQIMPRLIQTDEDLFGFLKYHSQLGSCKMPKTVSIMVTRYYESKEPLAMAQSIAERKGLNGWTHKDVMKLCHYTSQNPIKNLIEQYVLFGKLKPDTQTPPEVVLLQKADELRRTKDVDVATTILTQFQFTIDQVSSSLHDNKEVWKCALPNMSISQILPHLLKLYKIGLLKPGPVSKHLSNVFNDLTAVAQSQVHPIEVFVSMKKLEKGGKPLDIKYVRHLQALNATAPQEEGKKMKHRTPSKCPEIMADLNNCFLLACKNLSPSDKRYLVTIDVNSEAKKALCVGSKVLTFLEAAVAYTMVLLRVENDVNVAVYMDDSIELIDVHKDTSSADLLAKLKGRANTYALLYSPLTWAAAQKKEFDVFVNFYYNGHHTKVPPEKAFDKTKYEPMVEYRRETLPSARCITFAPVTNRLSRWKDAPDGILDILGFDAVACKVAERFAKGYFR